MGSQYFSSDKSLYVYNSASTQAEIMSSEYYLSYQSFRSVLKPILNVAQFSELKLGRRSQRRFREQKMIEHLVLLEFKNNRFYPLDQLVNFPREIKELSLEKVNLYEMKDSIGRDSEILMDYSEKSRFFRFMRKISYGDNKREFYLLGVLKLPELFETFAKPGIYMGYLVNESGKIVIKPKFWRQSQQNQLIKDAKFFLPAFVTKSPQGVFEKKKSDDSSLLVAYSQTKVPGTYAFSVVDRAVIKNSVQRFVLKSILILLMAISAVVLVSFVASHRLTQALIQLVEMTKHIAKGNFKIKSKINSQDEIQVLAENVEWMSVEVQKLMDAQMEQARMESELGMVQLVQKNLFPPLSHRVGDYSIECRFSSASEAGGDWFHYSIIDKYLLLWIGDATGHGAPAALITAAAKAASSVIETKAKEKMLEPSEILEMMNRAVNATAKKSVMMTFFIASINTETGEMVYANASHEFPMIVPKKENLKKKDFYPLCDVNGKRLGERPDSTYPMGKYQMQPGETIFMYTDGITDLENEDGQGFGDGRLLRLLAKIMKGGLKAEQVADRLDFSLNEYRGKAPLPDDLMYIVCQYNPEKKIDSKAS